MRAGNVASANQYGSVRTAALEIAVEAVPPHNAIANHDSGLKSVPSQARHIDCLQILRGRDGTQVLRIQGRRSLYCVKLLKQASVGPSDSLVKANLRR